MNLVVLQDFRIWSWATRVLKYCGWAGGLLLMTGTCWAGPPWRPHLLELQKATSQYMAWVQVSRQGLPAVLYGHESWSEGGWGRGRWDRGQWAIERPSGISVRTDLLTVLGDDGKTRVAYDGLTSGVFYRPDITASAYEQVTSLRKVQGMAPEGQDGALVIVPARWNGGWGAATYVDNSTGPGKALVILSRGSSGWMREDVSISTTSFAYVMGGLRSNVFSSVSGVRWLGGWYTISQTSWTFPVPTLRWLCLFSQRQGEAWQTVVLDTSAYSVQDQSAWQPIFVEGSGGRVNVVYGLTESTPDQLLWRHTVKRGWQEGAEWFKETIFQWDGAPAKVIFSGVVTSSGMVKVVVSWGDLPDPQFAYNSTTQCRLLTQMTGGWAVEICSAPETGTLAMSPAVVDSSGAVHMMYVTQKGEIKYASTRVLEDTTLLPIVAKKSDALVLANNYFNPGASTANYTRLYYKVATPGRVRVKVYTTDGVLVGTLVDEDKPSAGTFATDWAGKDETGQVVGTGLYVAELEAPGVREVKKIVVVK